MKFSNTQLLEDTGRYIPDVTSLRSVIMSHNFHDIFNPPALSNYMGGMQSARDITGIRSIHFPPLSQGEINVAPLGANGSLVTGLLYLDGMYLAAKNDPIDYIWQPDFIERRTSHDGFELISKTIVPFDHSAVMVRLEIRNISDHYISKELKLALSGGVTNSLSSWDEALSPGEFDNERILDEERGAVLFRAKHSEARSVQGCYPKPDRSDLFWQIFNVELEPGESRSITFTDVLDRNSEHGLLVFDALSTRFNEIAEETTNRWNADLKAAFTPGNNLFSGHVPTLKTNDEDIARLYNMTVFTALLFRRNNPDSVYSTMYMTLFPRYWVTTTFLWDISLSSMMLSLLDPSALKNMMEIWMEADIHKHFGNEYLTGKSIGASYSVNDFAMCRMAYDYLRWTGDFEWLDKEINSKSVYNHLLAYATYWRSLDRNGHGLADYGDATNLLEAVNNYVHEVAGMNAANVFNLRFAAELTEMYHRHEEAVDFRNEADNLLKEVLKLYVDGEGVWNCRLPDGSRNTVRHCYDFCTILTTIPDDLTSQQKDEMARFFFEDLQTPTWMRALSLKDHDLTFSIRPDHQWTGSYPAWPALSLKALFKMGFEKEALQWMQGLSETTRQGPFGQAHFAEDVFLPEKDSGALKTTNDQPYINDWANIAALAFFEPFVEGLFGVCAGLNGNIEAHPVQKPIMEGTELLNLRYQGRNYNVTSTGLEEHANE